MTKEDILITDKKEETIALGAKFAKDLKFGDVVLFYGNLGSGKTTFIQGLAKGLRIKRRIISPTFIIVRHYKINKGNFYHIDLYRTQNNLDIIGLGLEEILNDKNNIISIEWAQNLKEFLPKKRKEIHFKYLDDNKREIKIIKYE